MNYTYRGKKYALPFLAAFCNEPSGTTPDWIPNYNTQERIAFAILCGLQTSKNDEWRKWATGGDNIHRLDDVLFAKDELSAAENEIFKPGLYAESEDFDEADQKKRVAEQARKKLIKVSRRAAKQASIATKTAKAAGEKIAAQSAMAVFYMAFAHYKKITHSKLTVCGKEGFDFYSYEPSPEGRNWFSFLEKKARKQAILAARSATKIIPVDIFLSEIAKKVKGCDDNFPP
jgi:hypothetical protein